MSNEPQAAPSGRAAGRGSLLRAETRRLWSRRMVRVLLVLAALGFLGGVALASTQHAKPSPARLADAERRLAQAVAESEQYREQCLAQDSVPDGAVPDGQAAPTLEEFCGQPVTAENFGGVEQFLDRQPFELARAGQAGVVGVSAALGALAFLIGATYVGAEWSTRSMVALLFWEPRRWKVMAVKLVVLAGALALVALVVEAAWLGAAQLLANVRGSGAVPAGTWSDLLTGAGRGALFVVLTGLLGFGAANLIRNTGAALGVGFVYFAVVENIIRVLRPRWQEWLLTDNAAALLANGGITIYVPPEVTEGPLTIDQSSGQLVISNLHGGLVLAAVTAVVVTVGVVLFARRDLS